MKTEMIMKFKTMFEEQRKNLIYSQGYINEDFFVQKDDMLDDVDFTSSEMEKEMRMRLRNREALFLKKLEEALGRIKEGTFGQCDNAKMKLISNASRPVRRRLSACTAKKSRNAWSRFILMGTSTRASERNSVWLNQIHTHISRHN